MNKIEMATKNAIQNKAESFMSNSVGQRPVYGTALLSLRPEGAIAKLCKTTAHSLWLMPTVGSGLRLLRVASCHRAMPYANAERVLPLVSFNSTEFEGIKNSICGEFATMKIAKNRKFYMILLIKSTDMKKLNLMILVMTLFISCNNGGVSKSDYDKLKSDYDKLQAELVECRKTIEELKNTPQVRLINGQQYLAKEDYINAKKEFESLIEKYQGTDEAKKATLLLSEINKREQEKKEAGERKRTLGFKSLKEKLSVIVGDITIKFNSVNTGNRWNFDDYGTESWGRNAERGNIFILAKVAISSESKEPKLPPISVYKMANGSLANIGTLGYKFSRWRDYGAYLGNYSDYGNDFAHTKTINFSCGLDISNDDFTNNAIFVVVKKVNCFERNYDKYKNPPISYTYSGCNLKSTLTVDDFDNDYIVIKIFNKNKL